MNLTSAKRFAVRFFAVALLLFLTSTALDLGSVKAFSQQVFGYTCVSYIPAEWGEFKGGNQQSGLTFQDRNGTLRFVTTLPCDATAVAALEIRRTTTKPN
jgi:hypothetical protein